MERNTIALVADAMGRPPKEEMIPDSLMVLAEFERSIGNTPGIVALLLSTADGRTVANHTMQGSDPRRLAAMTNSFLTLGETMAKELGMSSAGHATVQTGSGNIVLVRIEGTVPLTLAAAGKADTTLATLLFAARECAVRIRTSWLMRTAKQLA